MGFDVPTCKHEGRPSMDNGICVHGGAFFEAIGEEFDDLDRRQAVINADVLDAWFSPSPSVLAAIEDCLPWLLQTAPPNHCSGLTRVIARTRCVPSDCVLPAAGSSNLIFLALQTWLTPASRVLILDPTYGEYAHFCERVIGCRVDRFPLDRGDQYEVNMERLEQSLGAGYDLVILVNPNNPTGRHVHRDHLEYLLRRAPERTRFWVDEAYVEYAGADQSLERFAAASPNAVVCKSLSKAYALSGVRVAYLVACVSTVDELRRLTPPWAVSLPAQVAAVQALQESVYYGECYAQTHVLREQLCQSVQDRVDGVEATVGVGNFILLHLRSNGPDAAEVVRRCRTRSLYIRNAGGMGQGLGDRAIRVAVKDAETQRRVVEILAWAASDEAGIRT